MDSRHQRQQRQHQQTSFYSQQQFVAQLPSSSTSSSAFHSTSSLASVQIPNDQTSMMQSKGFVSAPLPSPAATMSRQQSTCYFGSNNQVSGPTSHPQQPHLASASRLPPQQQFNAPQLMSQGGGEAGGAPETSSFLLQANLLAEAAKRAQMACLMRDMDDIAL
ncbi:hypothetical protein K431DRAFT_290284 [Polychaeton citri CBS 116435]|uniref:Uncharacterized protein n=1 Tax=Polychaeton citri CBS 116435 TaxID=1314669 RepID=A0A9P4UV39_9PEZI|nr:hypothetical protein K431DRAFT_290284 [Polychaeton citri CBS 116435]